MLFLGDEKRRTNWYPSKRSQKLQGKEKKGAREEEEALAFIRINC